MKTLIVLLTLLVPSTIMGQDVREYLNIQYNKDLSDNNQLKLDVYRPLGYTDPIPVVIYVHGGAWCTGDKSVFHKKKEFFNSLGYIFISVNYRLSPFPLDPDNEDRIKYPTHVKDVAHASAFVMDKIGEYGGDINRLAIIGHSAGAQIVTNLIMNESFLEEHGYHPSDFKCMCSLDTRGYDIPFLLNISPNSEGIYINAFGRDTAVWEAASAINHISEGEQLPELLFVHQDNRNNILVHKRMVDTLEKYTDAHITRIESPYDHGEINQLIGRTDSADYAAYTETIGDWFSACMSTSSSVETKTTAPSITVFPNPTTGMIHFSHDVTYALYDISGKRLISSKGDALDMSELGPGLYLLKHENMVTKVVKK